MMRTALGLLVLSMAIGCGDDTSSGGGGQAAGGNNTGAGNVGGNNTGAGNVGGNNVGGNNVGGQNTGGQATGGGGVGGFGPNYTCDAASGTPTTFSLTEVVNGLSSPVQAKSPPGRPDTLFILEKDAGRVRIFENGNLVDTPFLDIGGNGLDLIRTGNTEEGLLGIAFHPGYAQNGRFFLHYSASGNGDSTVQEFHRSDADPNVADAAPVQLVLQHPTAQGNHNGGAVEFGDDGYLYISMGDGGEQQDHDCDAQSTSDYPGETFTNLLGKISRLDVDAAPGADGYPGAPGNPNGDKYYHVGMRNPWRITWDYCDDVLYIGDVGQGSYEEVDAVAASAGAVNLGWPVREGLHDQPGYSGWCASPPANPVDPIAEYTHGQGRCSVSGGYVYRGSNSPTLRGMYFYGDYCVGTMYALKYENGALTTGPTELSINGGSISAFGQDGQGEVYVIDIGAGTVSRIDAI